MQNCGPSFLLLNLSSSRYAIVWYGMILYFHIFQGGFEVLNTMFQTSAYLTIVTATMHYNMYHCFVIY